MRSEEKLPREEKQQRTPGPSRKWRSRLSVRMTISYVGLSILNVLLLELVIGGIVLFVVTFSSVVDLGLQPVAQQTAQAYAAEAKLQGAGVSLDERMTFQPGQPFSIALSTRGQNSSGQNGFISQQISYIDPQKPVSNVTSFALLVAPDARVVASSYPAHYPASAPVARLLPDQMQHILTALGGQEYTKVVDAGQTHTAFVAEPVEGKNGSRVIGAIYVQISWELSGGELLWGAVRIWLLSGLVWLIVVGPLGTFFGVLTTRGLVRRIHGLVNATAQFARGDYTQRVPVKKQDEVGQLESQFNQMAEQLVESIEQRQALAEQHARVEERARIEQEMRAARYIQHTLLPKEVPALPGWQIAAYYEPAREVGGDFYDFLPLADNQLGIVIGDATDKGMAAALLMATTCTMLRTATQGTISPAEVLTQVNDLLHATIPTGMFATCFYAILDLKSGQLRYANAGHDWPYHHQANRIAELSATGMPLGMLPGARYDEQEVLLEMGESVFFYSDGLAEAHNAQREMFDLSHLKASLSKHSGGPTLINFMRDELVAFTGAAWEQEDDVTMVVLHRASLPSTNEVHLEVQGELHLLAEWAIASAPGNERQATEQVASLVKPLSLPSERTENLKTAVAEAVMNAMEHGNQYQSDKPVTLQVLASETALSVRIRDENREQFIAEPELPDIEAKLDGLQSPRGWGLFLIKHLVDEMRVSNEEDAHVVELIMRW
ncbi:MAG TPA: SpoIIE family protein phosphatase [Ktedonobacteraceae bacterium]|nr:SpoIIE family protein phosphatase [Ktedonobacteraceae bacterium]